MDSPDQNTSVLKNYYTRNYIGARKRQEDADAISLVDGGQSILLVVADGMGGHEAGDLAAKEAVATFVKSYKESDRELKVGYRLTNALNSANNQINSVVGRNPDLSGMGCTLVAARVANNKLSWVSVGDSILLLIRNGRALRLNADHSMKPVLEQAVKKGSMTSEDAKNHPDRNSLRSAITGSEISLLDVSDEEVALKRGDVILVASDGVLTLAEEEMAAIAKRNLSGGAKKIVDALIDEIKDRDKRKQDNTTVQAFVINEDTKKTRYLVSALFFFCVFVVLGIYFFAISSDDIQKKPWYSSIMSIFTHDKEVDESTIVDLREDKEGVAPIPLSPFKDNHDIENNNIAIKDNDEKDGSEGPLSDNVDTDLTGNDRKNVQEVPDHSSDDPSIKGNESSRNITGEQDELKSEMQDADSKENYDESKANVKDPIGGEGVQLPSVEQSTENKNTNNNSPISEPRYPRTGTSTDGLNIPAAN